MNTVPQHCHWWCHMLAEALAVVQAAIPCGKNSLKEERLLPDVWWLSSHILSFTTIPCLSFSVFSPPNCPCSVPVIPFLYSPKFQSHLASLVPIPLLSQPLSHCLAILSSPCPVSLLCISSCPLIFHPFMSYLHPIQLTLLISSALPFNSVQAATTVWAQQDSGTWWEQALCSHTWECTAVAGQVLYVPALDHALCRYTNWGENRKLQVNLYWACENQTFS